MRFDFEVGKESVKHFVVLPVHLHVVEFGVDPNCVEQSLQREFLEDEGVAAQTTSGRNYSTHSRWLKFLEIIWRQVLPIAFDDRSTRVMRFMPSST